MTNPLKELENLGTSPWYDNIGRGMLRSGQLQRLIDEDGLKGVTSNPTIFDNAISKSPDYDGDILVGLRGGVSDPAALFERLAVQDIREAADILRPVYESSDGRDGYVSLEVSPRLAYETQKTVEEARRLHAQVGRPNLMIKVPATREGLAAFTQLIEEGVNVNVTLIFSIERYERVVDAYLAGLERRAAKGGDLHRIASVASFFVSRIDTAVDKLLSAKSPSHPLLGKTAVANSKVAYRIFKDKFSSERYQALQERGARVQRLLWASTGTKNPAYSDVLYVDELIGPDVINTMPPATWDAFRDHGKAQETVSSDTAVALQAIKDLEAAGVNLDKVTLELEKAGVEAFTKSFESVCDNLARKMKTLDAGEARGQAEVMKRLWAKDGSLWKGPGKAAEISNWLGWLDMPQTMEERVPEIEAFSNEVRAKYQHIVILGMGGSSLAPDVLRQAFPPKPGYPQLHVLDSTDPEDVAAIDAKAPAARTFYIVSSKSGTTTEPLRLLDFFWAKAKGVPGGTGAGSQFAAITDPGSQLEKHAKENKFRKVFLNFPEVGGRYSALSYFGLVPAALAGIDLRALLGRAKRMALDCGPDSADNPGYKLGMWLSDNVRAGRDKACFLVSPEIGSFGLWLEQLLAESIGKEGRGIVPVTGEPLDRRHSMDRAFVYIRLEGSRDTTFDKTIKRFEKRHPVLTMRIQDRLDLGAEFFRWEIATAVLGHALGIDPFDQPDVQAAKDKTKAVLTELKEKGQLPVPTSQVSKGGVQLTFSKAAWDILSRDAKAGFNEHIARFIAGRPGDYLGVLSFLASDGRYEESLKTLKESLAKACDLPIQSGYGPRYLHSTGQLHKGGPNSGIFFVLTRADAPKTDIPGSPYGFDKLAAAQALGDFQALDAAGRRAVLVRLTGEPNSAIKQLAKGVAATASEALEV